MAKKTVRSDITPDSKSELDLLLAMLQSTTKTWRDDLRGVTDAELRWQPYKGGHSIGTIILHLVVGEYLWIQYVAVGAATDMDYIGELVDELTDIYKGTWRAPPKKPKAWFLKKMTDIRKQTLADLKGLKPATHIGKGWGREYSLRWILHHLIEHEAYHAGQMTMLREQYKNRRKK